jgi:hypothetical protein
VSRPRGSCYWPWLTLPLGHGFCVPRSLAPNICRWRSNLRARAAAQGRRIMIRKRVPGLIVVIIGKREPKSNNPNHQPRTASS